MKSWDLLACPACQGNLAVHPFEQIRGTVQEGVLVCTACQHWYPVTNGIPRLLLSGPLRMDDKPFVSKWASQCERMGLKPYPCESKTESGARQTQIQESFGHKWNRQSWWGLEGETAKVMEEWLMPRYGWHDYATYVSYLSSRQTILDAGCGLGRETLRMAEANPQAAVIGLELSSCIDEAAKHAAKRGVENVLFIQADLMAPPLKSEVFDFIFSEGVLHHTPNTYQAIRSLTALLAVNGEIAFYVYRKKAPLREYADDYIRSQIQDLPPDKAWQLMESLTLLGKVLHDAKVEVEIPEDVAVLGIKAGRYDLQRLIYYTVFKCYWNERATFDENVLVNFDWYHPRYAWRHTEEDVRTWLAESGLTLVHEAVEASGITVRARRATPI